MYSENFWMNGMWIFPFIMIFAMLFVVFMFFGRRGFMAPWNHHNQNHYTNKQTETPIDILKKRYANGEINKEEFDKIKKDII